MAYNKELVIIGAGPAGLAAANIAGNMGIDTLLIDDQKAPGGQIYRGIVGASPKILAALGSEYEHGRRLLNDFNTDHKSVTLLSATTVWQITEDGTVYYSGPSGSDYVQARRLILATGAIERAMPFPGWTLPGVMTAGAVQILLKTAGLVPAGRLILAGSGPLLFLLARQILDAGGEIVALVETTPSRNRLRAAKHLPGMLRARALVSEGLSLVQQIRRRKILHYKRATALTAVGAERLEGLRFTASGQNHELACDLLALHVGVVPNIQISRQLGLTHRWYENQRCWYPQVGKQGETELDWLHIAGDGGGIFGARAAEYQGAITAWATAHALGRADKFKAQTMIQAQQQQLTPLLAARPFIDCLYAPAREFLTPEDHTVICRCEEVTAKDIRHYVNLGCTGPNQIKAFGRPGMGPCQGRYCGLTVSELIAEHSKLPVADVGYYRIRPPIKPVTIGELAALHDDETSSTD